MGSAKSDLVDIIPFGEITKIDIETDMIAPAGQTMVQQLLEARGVNPLPDDWPWDWSIQKHDKYPTGKFSKRLKRFVVNTYGSKSKESDAINSGFLNEMSNALSHYTVNDYDYYMSLDEEFNWLAGDFYDSSSCYWAGYKVARLALRRYDALAVQMWLPEDHKDISYSSHEAWNKKKRDDGFVGVGRMLLADMGDKLIAFNAYGKHQTRDVAGLLAKKMGYVSQEISFYNESDDDEDYSEYIYINNNTGFSILPEKERGFTRFVLDWDGREDSYAEKFCHDCQRIYNQEDLRDGNYCAECIEDRLRTCDFCFEKVTGWRENITALHVIDGEQRYLHFAHLCTGCIRESFLARCASCNCWIDDNILINTNAGELCQHCANDLASSCQSCGSVVYGHGFGNILNCANCRTDTPFGAIPVSLPEYQLRTETIVTSPERIGLSERMFRPETRPDMQWSALMRDPSEE